MSILPLGESGNEVDFWFMYKVPKLKADGAINAATGFEYAYFDANSVAVTRSNYTLDEDNGALFHTLDALFANPGANTGWILYNDEVPDGPTSMNLGHSKGVIGFDTDSNTAFWLLHSWPKFPKPDDTAQPSPMFGQTFLCIALDVDSVRELTKQMLQFQEPQVYSPRIPTKMAVDDPIRLLTNGIPHNNPPGTSVLDLTSRGGKAFKVIAKNREWDNDFWNNLVAPTLETDIDVETWIRGKNVIPGDVDPSGQYHVEDIKYITLEAVGLPWAWPEVKDHAKWAVSEVDKGNWICVGDINRMLSQRLRGGGTIAFQDDVLWSLLSKTEKIVVPDGSGLTEQKARKLVQTTRKNVTDQFQIQRKKRDALKSSDI